MYDDNGKLVYLYRVIDGLCTRSQAFSAALTVGLPEEVVQRANEVGSKYPFCSSHDLITIHDSSCCIKLKIIKFFILFETLPI